MDFSIESFYNPHLALGATRLDAVLSVTASGGAATVNAPGGQKGILFVFDVSGSMGGDKLAMGKLAIRRCIDMLEPSSYFGVIAFSDNANVIVPLVPADPRNKARAHAEVQQLRAGGSTAMSNALQAAQRQFANAGDMIGFVQFVTDGENNQEDRPRLLSVIKSCEGTFQCDCWGVGTSWRPDELRQISGALLGTADAVPRPEYLEQHFQKALENALSKTVADVRLRLQTPRTSRIVSVKQMSPEIANLTALAKRVDEKLLDIPLGAWGSENREYHVVFEVDTQPEGEELMACRPKVVFARDGQDVVIDGPRIVAAWTTDETLSTRISPQVAHYTGQEELADSIREGLDAKARGDVDQATMLLGRAAKIAIQSGNEEVTQRLKKVVDVIDPDQGTVRLRAGNDRGAELELDMGGTRTVRRRAADSQK